jgi:hypothetical protein
MMFILIFALGAGFRATSAKDGELQGTCEQILERILTSGRDFIPAIEFRVWEKGIRAEIAELNSANSFLFAQHNFDIFDEADPTLRWMQQRLKVQRSRLSALHPQPNLADSHSGDLVALSQRIDEIRAARRLSYQDFHRLVPNFVSAMHSHILPFPSSAKDVYHLDYLDFEDENLFARRSLSEFENNSALFFLNKPLFFFWPTTEQTEFRYFNRLRPITAYPNALMSQVQDYDLFKAIKRPLGARGIAPLNSS